MAGWLFLLLTLIGAPFADYHEKPSPSIRWNSIQYGHFADGYYYSGDGCFRMPIADLTPPFTASTYPPDMQSLASGSVILTDDLGTLRRVEWLPLGLESQIELFDEAERKKFTQNMTELMKSVEPDAVLLKELYDPAWKGEKMQLVFFLNGGSTLVADDGKRLDAYRGVMAGLKGGDFFVLMVQQIPPLHHGNNQDDPVQPVIEELHRFYDSIEPL